MNQINWKRLSEEQPELDKRIVKARGTNYSGKPTFDLIFHVKWDKDYKQDLDLSGKEFYENDFWVYEKEFPYPTQSVSLSEA